MSLWKRGRQYWTDFTVAGRRYPQAAGYDESANGDAPRTRARRRSWTRPAGCRRTRPKRLSDAIDAYLDAKRIRCSPRTIEIEEERLSLVKKHFGDVSLSAITSTSIDEFQRTRHEAGIANRTINIDVVCCRACSSPGGGGGHSQITSTISRSDSVPSAAR
jgi:hypothetical protein